MSDVVYSEIDYKQYLNRWIEAQPNQGRGVRRQLAKVAGCQVAYVSHVLTGDYNFSLEHAEAISRWLGHSKGEMEYFLSMVQYARAGSNHLKLFFEKQMREKKDQYYLLKNRVKIAETLSLEEQSIYYSKWFYSAIHMILTIPNYRTPEKISAHFALPLKQVREVLDFLSHRRLVAVEKGEYKVKGYFLHLEKDSPLITQHHTNWRMKAIQSLATEKENDLHFSGSFTLSQADAARIKEILAKNVEDVIDLVKPSKEEKIFSISLDFFEL